MLVSTLLLGGCAFAPGMRFSPDEPVVPDDPTTVPTVTPITLAVIKRNQEQIADEKKNIKRLGIEFLADRAKSYRIGPGDILSIVVWDHPELVLPTQTYNIGGASVQLPTSGAGSTPQGYVVSETGTVQFPYAGAVKVTGLSINEAQLRLATALAKVIRDPQVTVRVTGFRSQRVYVDGEVRTPGVLPITDVTTSLVEALNAAGGILPSGDRSQVMLTRGGATYLVNIPQLLDAGVDPTQISLKNGDVIKVVAREENKVFVVGEVTKPTTVTLRNGRLSLNEALGDAGGVNPVSSDPKHIYVVRYQPDLSLPEVFHLDGSSPTALALAEQFELKRKDVVYVDSAPIVRWNRFISNLLPGLNTTFIGARTVQQ
ncbi:multidrug MFS transporter [Pigmentiphaga sp. NML030171]|nr:multidrug MFS transporter [Pigmentiphaga sp. NML030171]